MSSKSFPWYDGYWLENYYAAMDWFAQNKPEKLKEFKSQTDKFHTRQDFEVIAVEKFLDTDTIAEANELVASIRTENLENHELFTFGRMVVHDHDFFNKLQQDLAPKVGELVGEPVEPCYNFLSLYNNFGVCPVHMDAPQAKWTVDICLDQSYEWPIKFSDIMPWPDGSKEFGEDWQDEIVNGGDYQFTDYTLQPGNALIFSGSAQFHYRDKINRGNKGDYCNLVFLHYVPAGTVKLSRTSNWKEMFDAPDLVLPNTKLD